MQFGVLGAGSYGTAIAIALARRGSKTHLWGRDPDALAAICTRDVGGAQRGLARNL